MVSDGGYNIYLADLENYINTDKISFLTHDVTIIEWDNHKEKLKHHKERKLLNPKSRVESINSSAEILPSNFNTTLHLEYQTQQIDILLENAKVLSTPEGITNESHKRIKQRQAPFHKKLDSASDWEIIGSLGHYCYMYGIYEVYFISKNFNDFGNPNDGFKTIHPDIQERFHKLKFKYYINYSDFFKEIKVEYRYEVNSYNLPQNEIFTHKVSVKKNAFESILYLFKDLYKELSFVPIHILMKYYPFSKSKDTNGRFRIFSLYNVHDDLLKFVEMFEIHDSSNIILKETEFEYFENKKELEFVLNKLTHNLIYSIRDERDGSLKSLYYTEYNKCECARCSYKRLDFLKIFNTLKEDVKDIHGKLLNAYINYKIGNFSVAADLYFEISKLSLQQEYYIFYFISQCNLKRIYSFLNSSYYNKDKNIRVLDEIKNIDINEELARLKPLTDYNLLMYISNESFFNLAFQKISKLVSDILEHYFSQLKGGWASNKYVWELIEEYTKLDSFINENFIVYDKYFNFEDLFDLVLKGLLSSHAIKEDQGAKLNQFDDYWIEKIIFYARKESLIKYYQDYKLRSIKYSNSEKVENGFIVKARLFLGNEKGNLELEGSKNRNSYFTDFYSRLFENIITLAALLDLNEDNLNIFSENLLNFFSKNKSLNTKFYSSTKVFIALKGKSINENTLNRFVDIFLKEVRDNRLDQSFFKYLFNSFRQTDPLRIDYSKFNFILKTALIHPQGEYFFSNDSLLSLYRKSSIKRQEIIKKNIINKLNSDFNFDLFIFFTIYDVIPLDVDKVIELFTSTEFKSERHGFKSIFNGVVEYQDYNLDKLLNLYFRFKFKLNEDIISKIKSLNLYYEWLIDVNNFNYDLFRPEWIVNYNSEYYFREMGSSDLLIKKLFKYVSGNDDPLIKEVLLKIMYFSGKF
ncbi:hypothetical protein GCM10028803_18050 [Larkinella knui]|uniref:Uncharacterized protein n=2 Tax=Larkinella knui TaxID=2025310 RepID=A0A3P1CUC8_9BACT|nr:hypothetical protein [Larkinella knui]RRB16915.1 hypothetical protein EHT87_01090 [Larkinella knui]